MKIKLYLSALVILLAADALWLGFIARGFFYSRLAPVIPLTSSPVLLPAILFYLLFTAGILLFVVEPALKENSLKAAWLRGAFFGLVTYATYDLTNHAFIQNWPLAVTLLDLAWGSSISAVVSAITFRIGKNK
jgi:uncharacterized membrane protein